MVFFGLRAQLPGLRGTLALWGLSAALTLGLAEASRRWFEGPINARKSRFPYRAR
jgi:peptidoglycan/LPS O-acetylase OafA/YrhL